MLFTNGIGVSDATGNIIIFNNLILTIKMKWEYPAFYPTPPALAGSGWLNLIPEVVYCALHWHFMLQSFTACG